MNPSHIIRVFGVVAMVCMALPAAADEVPEKVKNLSIKLAELGTNATVVAAVQAQNATGLTLEAIKRVDEHWKAEEGVDDTMQELIDSDCGQVLIGWKDENLYLTEVFAMDNQGANVCMSDKTSDYWQGDEAKFIKSFAGGQGTVHISELELDQSSQSYQVQISIPVKAAGKVIGAMTFGVEIEAIE
ncbi:PDC sensor domain-containing protein [Magnetococcus sp. PR-3]|uniref:PDC sensor domain-containing protein n=1 Tax=Magnetococcus sp. PR-3 TaxID=3120355 RepID=UPI002FCE174F